MGRGMGHLNKKNSLHGLARDIETIVRLRPWIEDEWKNIYGDYENTILKTDYDESKNLFKFQIIFNN